MWIKGDKDKDTAENRCEPLCGKHRDIARKSQEQLWEDTEFRRFVD